MTPEEVKAMQFERSRLSAIVQEKDRRRRRSFMWYALFLTVWIFVGLFNLMVTYGPVPGTGDWTKHYLQRTYAPMYFPVVGFVIWAGVIGSFTAILIKFINFNPTDGKTLEDTESALRSGPAAVVVGAALSLVTFCAFSSGAIRGDIFPEFISTRSLPAQTKTPDVSALAQKNSQASTNASSDSNNAPPIEENKPADSSSAQLLNEIPEKRIETLRQDTNKEAERFHTKLDGESYYLFQLMRELLPSSPKSLALLLFWCFIAGYSQAWLLNWIKKLSEKNS